MSKITIKLQLPKALNEFLLYLQFLRKYLKKHAYAIFAYFEGSKDVLVDILYKKRGRYSRTFLHIGVTTIGFILVLFGPVILEESEDEKYGIKTTPILSTAKSAAQDFYTLQAEEVSKYRGGEIIKHVVEEGETISSIAERYSLKTDTVLWANDLAASAKIKPGSELNILPIDGVRHKVSRGETIYSIGKKYGLDESQVQMIIDYPFNEFLNDETFDLVVGQYLIVPEGVKPEEKKAIPVQVATMFTPDAGSVSATGTFIWPAAGRITQGYRFYHKAIDIANRSGGPILAADSGVVTETGWPDNYGYGNRVKIDHGNGTSTLYAHMSSIQVRTGQRVNRGDVLGQMGSTGRSTGTHLHFEIRSGGALLDPMSYLK